MSERRTNNWFEVASALVQFGALLAITTVAEFSGLSWAGWLALVVTIALGLYWSKKQKRRWLLYAILILTLFPEMQSSTIAGLELHHILAAVLAVVTFVPWIVLRPWPLPNLSRLLLVYFAFGAALTLVLKFTGTPITSLHRLFVTGLFILVAVLVPFVIKTKQHLYELFWVLTGATVLSAVVGLIAYYVASGTSTLFTNPYIHISTVEGVPRLAATLLDSNFLGHQLLLVVPGLLMLLMQLRDRLTRAQKISLYGITIFLTSLLLLTYSRSTYIGFAVALAVLVFVVRKRSIKLLITIAVASLAFATVLMPSFPFYSIYRMPSSIVPTETKQQLMFGFNPRALVDEYIKQIQSDPTLSEEEREQILARDVSSESLGYRIEFWKAGLRMFRDHPLTGVGVGQFRYRFAEYSDLSFIQQPDMHNIFVEQLAETGIFGLGLLLSVFGYAVFTLLRLVRKNRSVTATALLAVLLALLTQSLLLGGLGAIPLYLVLGVIARETPQTSWLAAKVELLNKVLRRNQKKGASKKRVVFITATTKKDGPGNVLFTQIRGLDRTTIEPTVITILKRGPWDAEYKKMGIRRINLGLIKPLDLLAPFVLWFILWVLRPDLVQTQMIRGDVYGRWAAMRAGVPFVSVVHNMDIWKHTNKRFHRFATWFDAQGLAQATQVVAVSAAVKQDIHTQQGITLDKITVIRNAVDLTRFANQPTQTELKKVRDELALTAGKPVILTVARVHPQKAPEVWLIAALKVLKKYPDATFLWVDTGPLLDQMRRAVPPEYRDRIRFIGRRKDIPTLLHLAELFVLPSRFEGLPMVLLEAMAAGRAAIATRVSGNPELISHRERGLLVAPENPQALARAIMGLLPDTKTRAQYGRAAQLFIKKEFTAERLSQEYQQLFAVLLNRA